jgi:1-acyl-sn-glycerol-3-phosphate acyltransferase
MPGSAILGLVPAALRFGAGLSVFLVYGLTIALVGWWLGPRRLFRYSQRMLRASLRAVGMRITVEGREQLSARETYVYLFNHTSFLDHFVVTCTAPGFVVGVEKIENFRKPVYGRMVKWWGNIVVDRADARSGIAAIRQARRVLKGGASVGLAPEGTRSADGVVCAFKTGGFEIASIAQRPIVPVSLVDMLGCNPDGRFRLRPGTVRIVYGAPIDLATCASRDDAMARVRAAMAAAGLTVAPIESTVVESVGGLDEPVG